ncbi:hypothetical protein ACP70R_008297 [Stipagrostis hirtigluma subsp. patula]
MMDMISSIMWFSVVLAFITTLIAKAATRGRAIFHPVRSNRPPSPPVVTGTSIIGLLHTLRIRGFRAMIQDQYTKLGSVFTVSFFGQKVTFLIGPEVSGHFFQGLDSEISHGKIFEFSVPMFGKDVAFAVDVTTRNEQTRFYIDALKPSKLRGHVGPMLQEVENYFAQWGQQGTVDLKQELDHLLMLIASRCLLGKEVREKMFDEVFSLFQELTENSLHLTSLFFPYAPTPMTRRRDKARTRLLQIFTEIVRSRKSSNTIEVDVLQNLIDSKYKDGRPTTEAEVAGLVLVLIFSGKHTSSAASTWTGARLLSHTHCMAAAIEEQQQITKKYGDHVDYTVLLEMDFLHRCIKEALRMHPTVLTFLLKADKSFTVQTKEGREYEIPRGHTLASPLLFNNYIPWIYKDPDVYDPNRFGPGREEDKVGGKFSYTAFSGGRHACAGEAYSYMQIKVIWSYLLRNFELKLVSSFLETDWGKIALDPKGKVMVSYKRRLLPSS